MARPDRILLTGAAGFVGRHLRVALARAFPAAVVIESTVDIRDGDSVAAMVRDERPDACVHLAAVSTVAEARRDADLAWQVNLHGTLHLARAILEYAPDCQMVFASTADAYGGAAPGGTPIDETVPLAPRSVYAATKAAADLALGSMVGDGLRLVRLRPFNHTGPGQSEDFVVPAFARQIARIASGLQAPVVETGNLDTWRDFLDVRDVCAAYVACIARRATLPSGIILNIGSGQSRRIGDVLIDLMTTAGISARIQAAPSRLRPNDVARACADASQAHALLGWAPTRPWSQTLHDVIEDWRTRIAAAPHGA